MCSERKLTPLYTQMPVAVLGALPMGVCSLLSHNYRRKTANPAGIRRLLGKLGRWRFD